MKKQILFTFIILSLLLASATHRFPQVAAGTAQPNGQAAATPTITATATPTPEVLVSQEKKPCATVITTWR